MTKNKKPHLQRLRISIAGHLLWVEMPTAMSQVEGKHYAVEINEYLTTALRQSPHFDETKPPFPSLEGKNPAEVRACTGCDGCSCQGREAA